MAILITFRKDWADEFDVENFVAVTRSRQQVEDAIENLISEGFTFGTNQGFGDEDEPLYPKDFLVREISAEEFNVLSKYFNTTSDVAYHGTGGSSLALGLTLSF